MYMKHHATADVPFTRALNRGVMFHLCNYHMHIVRLSRCSENHNKNLYVYRNASSGEGRGRVGVTHHPNIELAPATNFLKTRLYTLYIQHWLYNVYCTYNDMYVKWTLSDSVNCEYVNQSIFYLEYRLYVADLEFVTYTIVFSFFHFSLGKLLLYTLYLHLTLLLYCTFSFSCYYA